MVVEERGYLRSGEEAQLRIARDLTRGAMAIERVSAGRRAVEWISPEGGWMTRDSSTRAMSESELAIELQGLKQEPYAIYHRLARRDPDLRVELREQNRTLHVYDKSERLLCWFLLDGRGGLMGWGNFFDGAINQHWYGPLVDLGDANLPKWGAATTGQFRFEYLSVQLHNRPVEEPSRARR